MEEGLIPFYRFNVDKLHACINSSTICHITIANHAHLGRVFQVEEISHGDLKPMRIRLGGDIADYFTPIS